MDFKEWHDKICWEMKAALEYWEIRRNNPEFFTCYGCDKEETCEFTYDPYNTNGDCLMMK